MSNYYQKREYGPRAGMRFIKAMNEAKAKDWHIAKVCGVNTTTVKMWFKNGVPCYQAIAVAKYLSCDPADIAVFNRPNLMFFNEGLTNANG